MVNIHLFHKIYIYLLIFASYLYLVMYIKILHLNNYVEHAVKTIESIKRLHVRVLIDIALTDEPTVSC